jgi:hypothetical protein
VSLILRWLIVIPFALLLAMGAGMFALMIASVVSPELAQLVGGGMQALFAAVFDELADGHDPSLRAGTALALAGRLGLAIIVIPVCLVAVSSELFRLRSAIAQITATGALTAFLPLAMLRLGRAPTATEGRVIAALFLIGAVSGLMYWLIAGRKAGSMKVVSAPPSAQS